MRLRKLRRIVSGMPMSHVKSIRCLSYESRSRVETNFALLRRAIATCITLGLVAASLSVAAADNMGYGQSIAVGTMSVRRC